MSVIEFTEKNPRLFYNPNEFEFLKPIVQNFSLIKSELLNLIDFDVDNQWLRTFPNYVQSEKHKAWKVFSFIFFYMKFPSHAKLCPKTADLLYSIPEILSCDYSYLDANTKIKPHKGYTRMVLRCHLPLIVPDEQLCGIRVGDEIRHWKEGELMIFDDSFEHEAWNNTDKKRVVLMFDIPNPLWKYSAYEISKYKIEHMDDPFLLSMSDYAEWQKAFEKGIFPLESFKD
ncbi:MAG: aspH [Bacteroidota bacterium]|jgi:beta-hydroxylase|nr:aspH [Bacteroidota bacterium]